MGQTQQDAEADRDPVSVTGDDFDRIRGSLVGLPGTKQTKPATILIDLPIIGNSQTTVIETFKTDRGFVIFVQMVDAAGKHRFVLAGKAAEAIYRQRQSLADRSTPASRKRHAATRAAEKRRDEKKERQAKYADRNR